MRLKRSQAWLLCFLVAMMPLLAAPHKAQAFEVPGLGIRVCVCFPFVICPCPDEPDIPAGSGPAPIPGSRERDRYQPGRSEPSEAEQTQRCQEKEQEEQARQEQARQERLNREAIDRAWDAYRVDMDKAPDAHRMAQVVRHHREVLRSQYQERAASEPYFGQGLDASPSAKSAAVAAATHDVAQARVYERASSYSAHRGDDPYCEPVLSPSGRPFQTPPLSMDWQQLAAATDQYVDAKQRITHFSNYRDERQALLNVSAVLIETADDHFATGETVLGTQNVTTLRHLLDTAVDFGTAFVPPASMAWDAIQLATGSNLLTGEPLSKWDAGLLLADLVAFGCSKAFTKTARALVKVAAREGDAARLAKPWLNYIAKADEAAQVLMPKSQGRELEQSLGEQADQAIEYLVNGANLSPPKSKRVRQYEKSGGFAQAKADLERLADGRDIIIKEDLATQKQVFVVSLPNGLTANARMVSRQGKPTLEIKGLGVQRIKVRYDE